MVDELLTSPDIARLVNAQAGQPRLTASLVHGQDRNCPPGKSGPSEETFVEAANKERARKKVALEAASTGHSGTLESSSQRSYSLNADLPRPPRHVLSSQTLVQPIQNPSSQLALSDLPASITTTTTTNNYNPRSTLYLHHCRLT
ncbi:hypothetical protein PGT21_020005 [Puccinia graminis f. sp. tritici]|nr:hypothetical protein PGT21_019722 [Puccinia graminis f. sp. tritici]KAA1087034.1 hypothetical protein PGT21_020005 [Puccinia graminis f. sp. tritici]